MLEDMKKRRKDSLPKYVLHLSCLGQGRNTFGEEFNDMKIIKCALRDMPLFGCFANGESCHCRLYFYAGIFTLFL
jgi:small ligand-binding sensory domain FIST